MSYKLPKRVFKFSRHGKWQVLKVVEIRRLRSECTLFDIGASAPLKALQWSFSSDHFTQSRITH